MKLMRRWMLAGISAVLLAAPAAAVPITFSLDNVTTVGAPLAAVQTYTPSLPLVGSGDLDIGLGTGTLSLPDYSVVINVQNDPLVDDAQIDITGWTQTITAINSGYIESTGSGSQLCTVLGGLGGFICPGINAAPTIGGWSGSDPSLGQSASIDTLAQTITVIDTSDPNAGTITQSFSYTIVPEPGTALLLAGGLIGIGMVGRKRR